MCQEPLSDSLSPTVLVISIHGAICTTDTLLKVHWYQRARGIKLPCPTLANFEYRLSSLLSLPLPFIEHYALYTRELARGVHSCIVHDMLLCPGYSSSWRKVVVLDQVLCRYLHTEQSLRRRSACVSQNSLPCRLLVHVLVLGNAIWNLGLEHAHSAQWSPGRACNSIGTQKL